MNEYKHWEGPKGKEKIEIREGKHEDVLRKGEKVTREEKVSDSDEMFTFLLCDYACVSADKNDESNFIFSYNLLQNLKKKKNQDKIVLVPRYPVQQCSHFVSCYRSSNPIFFGFSVLIFLRFKEIHLWKEKWKRKFNTCIMFPRSLSKRVKQYLSQ